MLAWAEGQPWGRAMADVPAGRRVARRGGRLDPHAGWSCAELERLDEWPGLDRRRAVETAVHRPVPRRRQARHDGGRSRHGPDALAEARLVGVEIARRGAAGPRLRPRRLARRSRGSSATTAGRRSCWRRRTPPTRSSRSRGWSTTDCSTCSPWPTREAATTAEMGRPEEDLDLWKMVAEENGCFDRPTRSPTTTRDSCSTATSSEPALRAARGLPLHRHADVRPARRGQGHLAGAAPPRAAGGLAGRRAGRPRGRCHGRSGRDHPGGRESVPRTPPRGPDFAFNATNTMRQTRKRWIDLFADYGARIEVVYVEPPLPMILEQNGTRRASGARAGDRAAWRHGASRRPGPRPTA